MVGRKRFSDRAAAGRALAAELRDYARQAGLLVLGLPRGGVPVAYEVARALEAPLDLFLVRKLGLPGDEDVALGAIASGGVRFVNEAVTAKLGIADDVIARVAAEEQEEIERQERVYRKDRPELRLEGRTVVLVDDGMATGATMRAATIAARAQDPARLVVAVPVASQTTCASLRETVDDVVCSFTPEPFDNVGMWYTDFGQVSDAQVQEIMTRAQNAE